ncbi:hypothetical protein GCM10023187_52240 [Nibrella viscosa]|uniref:Alpha/beta hydrolase n=1 Tax=Nibrella viscosa TaxID=1084524 RepID=A0ABP8KZA7_9BACT
MKLFGFPFCEIEFTGKGEYSQESVDSLIDLVKEESITDLLVISHGWKNNRDDANYIYVNLLEQLSVQLENYNYEFNERRFGALLVFWPSRWLGGEDYRIALNTQLEEIEYFLTTENEKNLLLEAKEEAKFIGISDHNPRRFLQLIKKIQAPDKNPLQLEPEDKVYEHLDPSEEVELLARLVDDESIDSPSDGHAAGFGQFTYWLVDAAQNFVNNVTYSRMRERAGVIGWNGLHKVLSKLKENVDGVKLHLVGHSFGARLVTAAVSSNESGKRLEVDTLTLLQAAFSQYAFASKKSVPLLETDGMFRNVISDNLVKGPILITYSKNDISIRKYYELASKLVPRHVGTHIRRGNELNLYGGLGNNGAQEIGAITGVVLNDNANYTFSKGLVYNLDADQYILGHSDILKPGIAKVILSAIKTC